MCRPIAYNWNPNIPGGSCGNKPLVFATVGFVDLAADLVILVLPMPVVFGLKLPLTHRVCLAAIFGFGIITMIFTAIRLYYVYHLDFTDITYSGVMPSILSSVQMRVGIMVASSPLLRPLFDRTIGSCFGLSQGSRVPLVGKHTASTAPNPFSLELNQSESKEQLHPNRTTVESMNVRDRDGDDDMEVITVTTSTLVSRV